MKTLQNLFEDGLRDIYYAEQKILDALSKMADAAIAEQAAKAFRLHREQTEGQIERLEQVFEPDRPEAEWKAVPGDRRNPQGG